MANSIRVPDMASGKLTCMYIDWKGMDMTPATELILIIKPFPSPHKGYNIPADLITPKVCIKLLKLLRMCIFTAPAIPYPALFIKMSIRPFLHNIFYCIFYGFL